MDKPTFESLVAQTLDSLPQEFIDKLDNVDVVVEIWPSPSQLQSVGLNHPQTLFGLYQGVPQTKRRGGFQYPDKITIFAGPMLSRTQDPQQLQQMVEKTVKHEIAHHFGMDEHSIRKRGY